MYVKELDMFLTTKVLENTPAVLSLGKLCDDNGYSCEWINGQKPHLIKNVISDTMQHGELRSYRGSRLVKFVFRIFINFKDTFETGESLLNIFSSSSSSPTVSGTKTRERKDRAESDISPVTVSTTVDERSGRPGIDQAKKKSKTQ